MTVPFPDINPYDVLKVAENVTPSEIRKAYFKLSLKYHPDKRPRDLKEKEIAEFTVTFQKIQFAYSILSDINKRKKYDQTGQLEDFAMDEDGEFNWKDYFDSTKTQEITPELIEKDKKNYQNSKDEENDIYEMYQYYEGDFLLLFESIPHSDIEKDEKRFFKIIQNLITEKKLVKTKKFEKYIKKRDQEIQKQLKKNAKEAKEAEILQKELNIKKTDLNDLAGLIQKRNNKRAAQADDFFAKLEEKYSSKKKKKTTKK
ncbi:hypothetical protein PACTADRAFT_79848 [Pachysolen tannophilus NRRL Y-2460]|uniref:J domain-containing protein n=1 Tax=Pachysolen tannophilus NRRL Y-2460 TaxID=669874 RepID=A0A1E4TVI7_PACTA|nr:hypothetical protein PACTADRAFT_79848 [Pachysolen tannophilus NRRL Y-2460]